MGVLKTTNTVLTAGDPALPKAVLGQAGLAPTVPRPAVRRLVSLVPWRL